MNHTALSIIRDEHQALAAMLRSLLMLLDKSRKDRQPPPFDVLRAMLFYIDEFPERHHHPKESDLLFPKVARIAPDLMPVIERLESDRDDHEDRLRKLELWQTEIKTVLTLLRWTFGASILGAVLGLLNLLDMLATTGPRRFATFATCSSTAHYLSAFSYVVYEVSLFDCCG